jgi:hypothetical protein
MLPYPLSPAFPSEQTFLYSKYHTVNKEKYGKITKAGVKEGGRGSCKCHEGCHGQKAPALPPWSQETTGTKLLTKAPPQGPLL